MCMNVNRVSVNIKNLYKLYADYFKGVFIIFLRLVVAIDSALLHGEYALVSKALLRLYRQCRRNDGVNSSVRSVGPGHSTVNTRGFYVFHGRVEAVKNGVTLLFSIIIVDNVFSKGQFVIIAVRKPAGVIPFKLGNFCTEVMTHGYVRTA